MTTRPDSDSEAAAQRLRSQLGSDRLFEAVARSSSDAILALSLDGTVIAWNDAATRTFGFEKDEIIGRSVDVIVPEAHRFEVDMIFDEVRQGRTISHFETFRLHKDGHLVEVSLSVSPVYDAAGTIIGATKISHATGERKFAEAKFRLAFEASPSGMIMIDSTGQIVFANKEMERLIGCESGALAGTSIDALVPERFRARHAGHRGTFWREPSLRAMGAGRDLFALRKDGTEIPVEIGLNPIFTATGMITLAAINDISSRKKAEAAIFAQTEELRRSNAELEQFAYVASHDLQEPLRMVASYTQLLSERYAGQLDERADKYIHYASDGAKRMQVLVSDLLAFSRLSSHDVRTQVVDTGKVVEQLLQRLVVVIEQANAQVTVEPLPRTMGDETELGQIFQNLISNAIKFRGERQVQVRISGQTDGAFCTFHVADNGIGIDRRFHERIFQMFQRLHERRKYEGSGMGLAIAKKIVERRNGKIWVTSEPGQGATFSFTYPATDEASP